LIEDDDNSVDNVKNKSIKNDTANSTSLKGVNISNTNQENLNKSIRNTASNTLDVSVVAQLYRKQQNDYNNQYQIQM
jgi:hypothetical protein